MNRSGWERYKWKSAKNLALGAVLIAIAVIIQVSPLYLPVVGVSISGLSTLPIALAAYYQGMTGLLAYLGAGFLLFFCSVPQAIVFLFSSGLLGLSMGVLLKKRPGILTVVAVPAFLSAAGIIAAGALLGIPVFPWLSGLRKILLFPIMVLACLVYTAIWIPVLAAIIARLRVVFENEETDEF